MGIEDGMQRRKKRAYAVRLNFVQAVPGKRKRVRIKPADYPLAPLPFSGTLNPNEPNCSFSVEEESLSHSVDEVVREKQLKLGRKYVQQFYKQSYLD